VSDRARTSATVQAATVKEAESETALEPDSFRGPGAATAVARPPSNPRTSGASGEKNEQPDHEVLEAGVGIGRRVVVLANLGLTSSPSAVAKQAAAGLAKALDSWQGPGTVVVAGNLLDLRVSSNSNGDPAKPSAPRTPAELARAALKANSDLARSLREFSSGDERRLICLPGDDDSAMGTNPEVSAAVVGLGAEVVPEVDLLCETAAGSRTVKVLPRASSTSWKDLSQESVALEQETEQEAEWQGGIDRLVDSSSAPCLVRSRTV
jgi:hypothetical protein